MDNTVKVPKSAGHSLKHARTRQTTTLRDHPPRKKKKTIIAAQPPKRRTERKAVLRDRPGIVPYVSDDAFEDILKTPPLSEDQHLGQSSDAESSQLSSKGDSHTLRSSMDSATKNFLSPTLASKKPYTAPTAPMVVDNEKIAPISSSAGTSPTMEDPKVPSKSQVDSLSPRVHFSKEALQPRLSTAETESSQPELPEHAMQVPIQTVSAGQMDHESNITPRDASLVNGRVSPALARPASEPQRENAAARDSLDFTVSTVATNLPSYQQLFVVQTTENKAEDKENLDSKSPKIPHSGSSSSAEKIPSKPRSKIQVPLWIITREPRYTEELWDDGKFQGTLLSDFIKELSNITQRDHIEKLKLTLRTPTFDTKITVFRDAEDSWLSAKETFVEKLKEARTEAKAKHPNEPASFKILVEPFIVQNASIASNVDDDDEEFAF